MHLFSKNKIMIKLANKLDNKIYFLYSYYASSYLAASRPSRYFNFFKVFFLPN